MRKVPLGYSVSWAIQWGSLPFQIEFREERLTRINLYGEVSLNFTPPFSRVPTWHRLLVYLSLISLSILYQLNFFILLSCLSLWQPYFNFKISRNSLAGCLFKVYSINWALLLLLNNLWLWHFTLTLNFSLPFSKVSTCLILLVYLSLISLASL